MYTLYYKKYSLYLLTHPYFFQYISFYFYAPSLASLLVRCQPQEHTFPPCDWLLIESWVRCVCMPSIRAATFVMRERGCSQGPISLPPVAEDREVFIRLCPIF